MVTLPANVSVFSFVCRVPTDFSAAYQFSLALIFNDAHPMSLIHQYAGIPPSFSRFYLTSMSLLHLKYLFHLFCAL